mmetsp:Transcript_31012/g.50304  ORF Transcript_31012/g.50304 Transcript_31012/m.50304 type:complete len:200 (+) Transcript_31012:27-626(+)
MRVWSPCNIYPTPSSIYSLSHALRLTMSVFISSFKNNCNNNPMNRTTRILNAHHQGCQKTVSDKASKQNRHRYKLCTIHLITRNRRHTAINSFWMQMIAVNAVCCTINVRITRQSKLNTFTTRSSIMRRNQHQSCYLVTITWTSNGQVTRAECFMRINLSTWVNLTEILAMELPRHSNRRCQIMVIFKATAMYRRRDHH